uniref:Uncharacterized protein n=1 Tax=Rhizophora mucronata TaxID=61149 RepID=A0A2P2Q122_RHIMU
MISHLKGEHILPMINLRVRS